MRNLLGRLNARTTDELTRIAAAWQVPLSAGDRHGMVSRLYRALADPRTVRDYWDRLPEDEQAMVRLLAVSEETALTLPELAGHLGVSEEEARQSAVRLYHKGIVAREGDDDPLPVGVLPRLFLPRELTLLFRRVQDEIDAGDVSETPLRALLALLDDRELEEAAETWGVRVIPGLRGRDDLTRQLLHQVGDPDRVASVAAKRTRDAALIWRRLQASPVSTPVPLADAAQAAGLATGDPRQAQRLRAALAELESALLVWHTYRPGGSRWLFIPAEIRAPIGERRENLPALAPVLVPPAVEPPWRPSYALAWDLLTLLRELGSAGAPQVHDAGDLPASWRRRLNRGFWYRGADLPPAGYVEFLVALARAEGVLVGGAETGQEPLSLGPAVRLWRDRSFGEQMARLQWWWLAKQTWIEGIAREDVDVWGAEWVPFRRKLLVHLAALADDTWYALEDVVAWLAARDPEMLGATFTVATARRVAPADDDDVGRRQAAIAEVAAVTLETAIRWFGFVDIADRERQGRLVRLTAAGRAVANAQPPSFVATPVDGPPLVVSPSGVLELHDPSPLRVWSLTAFADLARLDRATTYHLSEDSVARALAAGFETRQILSFLSGQAGAPVPAELEQRLQAWTHGFRRVRMRRAMVVTPDDADLLDELREVVAQLGLTVTSIEDALVVVFPTSVDEDRQATLVNALREAGFTPQWDTRDISPRRRDDSRPESGLSAAAEPGQKDRSSS